MTDLELVTTAETALARGAWQDALEALDAVDCSAATLELRANALYGAGRFEASVTAWEDLHAMLTAQGDPVGAARAAAMAAMFLMIDTGLMAPVRGWLRRAERLLEGHAETAAHAVIAMVRTYERFMCGDMEAARLHSALAIDLGERLDVMPAVVVGRTAAARVTILEGDLDDGLAQLDEVGALLMSGAVDSLTTGMMLCELICAAQGLSMHDRASEWTDVMERWRHGAAFGGINGRCRVHRAEMMRMSGPCDAAEAEALAACEELRPWMRREFGWPLAELGTIRLRKGDLAGAEESFLAAHRHAWAHNPGYALLLLAKGDVAGALDVITDAIANPSNIPSKERPPYGDLCLAPLLAAHVEIAARSGDVDGARASAVRLGTIAAAYPSGSLRAGAVLADARVALLEGRVDEAAASAAQAAAAWSAAGAPYECAESRVLLGHVHAVAGRPGLARIEWNAARAAFDAFGARGRVEEVASLLADPAIGGGRSRGRVERIDAPSATFRADGDMRTLCFGSQTVRLRDLKGFRYVERLLREPGREFHVIDLIAVERGSLPTVTLERPGDHDTVSRGDAPLPLIDDAARAAYRRRLADVDDDIEEATRTNDLGRLELAQRDRDYLITELETAVGLGGRERGTGGTVERARTSVTRSIRYAIDRIAEHHPSLAAHLDRSVHTGMYCCYSADPLALVTWET